MRAKTILVALVIIVLVLILNWLINPLDKSKNIEDFFTSNPGIGSDAVSWGLGGSFFRWQSEQSQKSHLPKLNIFYRTFGNINNPSIVMIHGWPTSSYDFQELIRELENDFYIAVIDTPGYGFSDKPQGNYRYSILDDALLFDFFIKEILEISRFTLLTHDKGDTVGFAVLDLYQQASSPDYLIDQHIILNGGIYLPLAELSAAQKYFTLPVFGYFMTRFIFTPERFTTQLAKYYSPELSVEEQLNIASFFQYQGGTTGFTKTLRYIADRKKYEETWLQALNSSDIPTTLIWGELDPIARLEIADFVWANYLRNRDAPASYWRLPCASHYPQNDQPEIISQLIRQSLLGEADVFSELQDSNCSPILVEET